MRGSLGRRDVLLAHEAEEANEQDQAARVLQAGLAGRDRRQGLAAQQKGASTVQAAMQGKISRQEYAMIKEQDAAQLADAAEAIQAVMRASLSRRETLTAQEAADMAELDQAARAAGRVGWTG